MSRRAGHAARREHREAFWTLAVGAPAALAIQRLWVESGGELQTTLLLVANVGPLNLGAALFATVTHLATVVLIALFAAGAVLRISVDCAPDGSRLRTFPPIVARIAEATPPWFVYAIFALAMATWPIYALPLLVPAAVATSQRPPWRIHDRWQVATGFCLAVLVAYFWLVGPAVWQAWTEDEQLIALLLALPPVAAFGVAGALPARLARSFSVIATSAILVVASLAFRSAARSPILPLVVAEVGTGENYELVRGHVVTVDDLHLILLQELGGVRYIPVDDVRSTVLCATAREIPAFDTRIRDYHVEDSLLTALGRHVRPFPRIDPLCRMTPSEIESIH